VAALAATLAWADAPAGRLAIKTIEGVKVQVDDQPLGEPSGMVSVQPGAHTVRVYEGEELLSEHHVKVEADETVWVELRVMKKKNHPAVAPSEPAPERPAGVANVEIRSHNVIGNVAIDGVVVGLAPLRVRNLPSGKHTVQVLVDGVPRRTRQVTVRPGAQRLDIL
jgi:hypothetical protein